MDLTTSYHKPQTTQLDEGQIWVQACHNATRKLLTFLLSRSNQKKLHITATELNLSSGDPLDYGPRFVKPFSHEKMREYVDQEQPWDKYDIHSLNIDDTPELYKFRRWHNARHVIGILHCTLENFFGGDAPYRFADEE